MQQSACNALMIRSNVNACNVGISLGGCGGTGNPVHSWPSAQVGDGVDTHQNNFNESGIDIYTQACGSAQVINDNMFYSGYRGIVIAAQSRGYFEVRKNQFWGAMGTQQMAIGIQTNAGAVLSKLVDNIFDSIAESAGADTAVGVTTGFALRLGGPVLQALRNQIEGNDNGISLDSAPAAGFDFSSGGVAANANKIGCNSKIPGGGSNGYDLVLNYSGGSAPNFSGNVWDHSGPSTSVSLTTSTNGTDVVTGTSNGATVSGSSALPTLACRAGRVQ
jgi:hypothetical protein